MIDDISFAPAANAWLTLLLITPMNLFTLAVSYLTIFAEPTLTLMIEFSNPASGFPFVTQTCLSDDLPDLCCEPLDLDITDGRGYGWFFAQQVFFNNLNPHRTVVTVYKRGNPEVCSGETLSSKFGVAHWETPVYTGNGAGSALTVASFQPLFVRKKWPDFVNVAGVEYWFVGRTTNDVLMFRSPRGLRIYGRPFSIPVESTTSNGNKTDILSQSLAKNVSAIKGRPMEQSK